MPAQPRNYPRNYLANSFCSQLVYQHFQFSYVFCEGLLLFSGQRDFRAHHLQKFFPPAPAG